MEQFKLAAVMMAVADSHWGPVEAHGRRRQFSADELDALADWGWHLPDLTGVLAACVNAVRLRWRLRVSHRIEPTPVPSAAVPSPG